MYMLKKEYNHHREQKIASPKSYTTYTDSKGNRVTKRRRGQKRYFVYIQERFGDIYCFIKFSMGVSLMEDGFKKEELVFVENNHIKVKNFLTEISKQKNKSITFSLNSVKIN